jgi:hypothetical protein
VDSEHALIEKIVEEGSLVSSDTIVIDTETRVFKAGDRVLTSAFASTAYFDNQATDPDGRERCRNSAPGTITTSSVSGDFYGGFTTYYRVAHEDGKTFTYEGWQLHLVT